MRNKACNTKNSQKTWIDTSQKRIFMTNTKIFNGINYPRNANENHSEVRTSERMK